MESIIERIKRGQFWKFHGGIHPPSQKFLTNEKPIKKVAIPPLLRVPVRQHIGEPGDVIVAVGQKVLKGQPLTSSAKPMVVPIHAPTSGTVTAIELSVIAHPSGMSEPCVFIEPDGNEEWVERNICPDFRALSRQEILEKIHRAGISGMGGAGFPSHIKVGTVAPIDYLIINAAECEPYITADDLLMREQTAMIVDGIEILDHVLNVKHILIGIEDNKPEAISALNKLTANNDKMQVCVLPTIYPTGGEKQLIQVLTGMEVPSGVLPSALGVVMQNVGSCYAIADAVLNDKPLIERVVTVSGQALEKPQNVWALLGTPVQFLLDQCNNLQKNKKHIIMGGPMMGFSLPSTLVPVVKTTNCILAPSEEEIPNESKETECIRCGQCAEVCPSLLLPQELQWSAKAKDQDQLKKLNLFDCIECGACAYVCPSHIPLVHYYRVAKAEIRQQQLLDVKAEKAKQRFEARKARLEREKKVREEKQNRAAEARRARMNSGTAEANKEKSAVAAALARVKAKKNQEATSSDDDSNKSRAAAAIARAKAKKQAQQTSTLDIKHDASDEKKPQVADAIARAKAKKAQRQTVEGTVRGENASSQTNDKLTVNDASQATKAAQNDSSSKASRVAAAVAKAKAKKAKENNSPIDIKTDENNTIAESASDTSSDSESAAPQEAKSARIAAAVAKAKAKKKASIAPSVNEEVQAVSEDNVDTSFTPSPDEKKAARIKAAVAKAKAKKQQLAPTDVSDTSTEIVQEGVDEKSITHKTDGNLNKENTDVRSTKIASAIAKAKAKKSAASNVTPATDEKAITTDETPTEPLSSGASESQSKKEKIAAAIAKAKAKKQQLESK